MKVITKATVIFDRVIEVLAVFAAILLIFLMLLVCADVIGRLIFHKSIYAVIEIAEYSLLFITFLAATWVLRGEGHVKIDVIVEMFKPRTRAYANLTTSVICAIASIFLCVYGVIITLEQFTYNIRFSTQLMPPAGPIIAVVPLGYLLLFPQFMRRARKYLGISAQELEKEKKITTEI